MAHEALGEQHARALVVGRLVEPLLAAGDRRRIVGAGDEEIDRNQHRTTVRGQLVAADIERKRTDRLGIATLGRHPPELVDAVLCGEEIDARAVRRPARGGRIERGIGQSGRLAAGHRHGPDAVAALVRGIVGFAQLQGNRATVRREYLVADPVHHDQVPGIEWVRCGGNGSGENQQECGNQAFHGHRPRA